METWYYHMVNHTGNMALLLGLLHEGLLYHDPTNLCNLPFPFSSPKYIHSPNITSPEADPPLSPVILAG